MYFTILISLKHPSSLYNTLILVPNLKCGNIKSSFSLTRSAIGRAVDQPVRFASVDCFTCPWDELEFVRPQSSQSRQQRQKDIVPSFLLARQSTRCLQKKSYATIAPVSKTYTSFNLPIKIPFVLDTFYTIHKLIWIA